MRGAVTAAARAGVLAGPAAVALADGGYFDRGRLIAGLVACLLAALAAVASPRVLPATRTGRLALVALAALTAWAGLSLLWTPVPSDAVGDLQRLLLYLAALVAATAWLRGPRIATWVEPALAGGILLVIGYGLSERVAPWAVELARSASAGGRLSEPLGYWNSMGALAAMGLALCAGIAADSDRSPALRALAAAAAAPLGAGVALSFSRGALLAAAFGALAVVAARGTREQARTLALAGAAAAIAGAVAAALPVASSLDGDAAAAARDGVVLAAALIAAGGAVAGLQRRWARNPAAARLPAVLRRPAVLGAAAAALAALVIVAVVTQDRGADPAFGADAQRLGTIETNRTAYWSVAAGAFLADPLRGTGAAGWRVDWLRDRTIAEGAKDGHSLPLETAAELGVPGLALLATLIVAVVAALRRARDIGRAWAGVAGALAAWAASAAVDWTWELPGVTLFALVAAGALLAAADGDQPPAVNTATPRRARARAAPPPAGDRPRPAP